MAKYRWREVVIEKRHGVVSHHGRVQDLVAKDLSEARAEVERAAQSNRANCFQILDETGTVISYKVLHPEFGKAHWA